MSVIPLTASGAETEGTKRGVRIRATGGYCLCERPCRRWFVPQDDSPGKSCAFVKRVDSTVTFTVIFCTRVHTRPKFQQRPQQLKVVILI